MVSPKGKRKIIFGGNIYYWFVRRNCYKVPRIYILSEDKKINMEFPMVDTEVAVTPQYIRMLIEKHFNSNQTDDNE